MAGFDKFAQEIFVRYAKNLKSRLIVTLPCLSLLFVFLSNLIYLVTRKLKNIIQRQQTHRANFSKTELKACSRRVRHLWKFLELLSTRDIQEQVLTMKVSILMIFLNIAGVSLQASRTASVFVDELFALKPRTLTICTVMNMD